MTKNPSVRRQRKRKAQQPNPFDSDQPFTQLRVRRAPKYVAFLIAGGIVGIIAALVVAFIPGDTKYSTSTVFGFFLVVLLFVGVALGGVAALLVDWLGRRRQRRLGVKQIDEAE